jgi:Acyl-ACP thioesterase
MNASKRSLKQEFTINSLLVNSMGRLGLYGTLNVIQETAWSHAEILGFGMKDMEEQGNFWVLTRQCLQMTKWPSIGRKITVETWLRPPDSAYVMREFLLRDLETGEEIGKCTTTWLALSRDSKHILPLQDLRPWADITENRATGITAGKIMQSGEFEMLARFRVRNSDIDVNQHVNNTKYSQWILDAIPFDTHKANRLKEYSVNFLAETHLGEKVEIERCMEPTGRNEGAAVYRGRRTSDGKIIFSAKMIWEPLTK